MKFKTFVKTADEINSESSNNEIRDIVAEFLTESDKESLEIIPRFIQGRIFPAHDERKTNVSTSLMRKAISEVTGIEEDTLNSRMPEVTDMGSLFDEFDIKTEQGQQVLGHNYITVSEVYNTLSLIASTSGSGSQEVKVNYMVSLLMKCSSIEAKYFTKLILGNLSIGVGGGTVRKAISKAYNIDEDSIERALMLTNDAGEVAKIADKKGSDGIRDIKLNVGSVPILSMKAKESKPIDVFEDMDSDEVYVEYKYDGFRIQAHKVGSDVTLYTRNLQDVTSSLPDVVQYIKENVTAEKAVLDGEAVGYHTDNFIKPQKYQVTQKRIRRKHGIEEMIEEIPTKPHFFDVLYFEDDGLLIDEPLETRKNILNNICSNNVLSRCEKCSTVNEINDMIIESNSDGHEGAMAKSITSTYEPNSRGKKWLKLKPDGETIDTVIIGGTYGDGRKSDFIASFEIGIWNTDTNQLEHIGNVGNGVTEEHSKKLTEKLEKEIIKQDGRSVELRPTTVLEVEFEDVQPSPKYESGFALRFPRIVDQRDTKDIEDADSISRLKKIAESI